MEVSNREEHEEHSVVDQMGGNESKSCSSLVMLCRF